MTSIAVGKFDALHLGHRALALRAAALGSPALLRLTGLAEAFGWALRQPIVAEDDRSRVLATWHPDLREIVADIRGIRDCDAAGFLDWLRRTHGATALVVGADFRCGRGRSAGVAELADCCAIAGVRLEVVDPVLVDGAVASSSRVREALLAGDCTAAALCLGRPHRLAGTVLRGDGRGRTLGFPTANLGAAANLLPRPGVYAAWAIGLDRPVRAAVNVGRLPTVAADRPLSVEAHLLGWSGDCYGMAIGLDLIGHIRPERRFASLDELREHIARDLVEVERMLA